jgi:hemerythrin-like domain-containing protein
MTSLSKRRLLVASSAVGAALLLAGCDNESASPGGGWSKAVTPDEDLMQEHGVLRRCLLVYAESAVRLRRNPASVPVDALNATAMLFRRFGEDYHERGLEERFVFPALRRFGGPAAEDVDILVAQHNRGRAITDFVLEVTGHGRMAAAALPLAASLASFVWMYENHSAREDTVVYPAWKEVLSAPEYQEMARRFVEVEGELVGANSFGDAVARIGDIEQAFGMTDLGQFTAPPPPRI